MITKIGMVAAGLVGSMVAQGGDIKVYVDKYGVPSIIAASLADASYAEGYAQAKDFAERMELNYKVARGRSAEVNGKSALLQDTFLRGLGLEDRAIREAPLLTGEAREVIESFVQGANRAISEQKGSLPAWVGPITDVDVLALTQFVNAAFPLLDLSARFSSGRGSNQFALSPARTSTKHPVLSIDPHLGWDGQDGGIVWQEFAVYTPAIKFRGVAVAGVPLGVLGHNDRVAWSMTNNNPDLFTLYTVKTNPANRKQYNYHGQWKDFDLVKAQMSYLDNGQRNTNDVSMSLTEWGPTIPMTGLAAKFSIPDPATSILEGVRMMEAKSVDDFRAALNLRGMSMWNYVFADVAGNIAYQYNAYVPKRDESFDWSKPIPGDDPKTVWGPIVPLDELPHDENPASGILVNCNTAPYLTTLGSEIKKDWPPDVTSYGNDSRWEMLSSLLIRANRVTPDQAMAMATDCTVPYAAAAVDALSQVVQVGAPIEVLKKWDKKATVDSVGCVLYTYWLREDVGNARLAENAFRKVPWTATEAALAQTSLDSAAQKMIKEQGSLTVRWGDVQYMQRGDVKMPVEGFGYALPHSSLAAINPASAGGDTLKGGRSHATFGSSFRMVVSLDPKGIQSWSVLPYGNSTVASSPHYTDQMALYSVGKYKSTKFGANSAVKGSVSSYSLSR